MKDQAMSDRRGESSGDGQTSRGGQRPVVILACSVMKSLIDPLLPKHAASVLYLDYGLHTRPAGMRPVLQAHLDGLPAPSLVLLGYGLCGNGVVGLRSGRHTLVIPRTDDCIAILLGSRQAYLQAFRDNPGTYYLTRGWFECGSDPLSEHRAYIERFGRESADALMDAMYGRYSKLCFISHSEADLEAHRPRARQVAEFCAARWGMTYEERIGSDALIRRLLAAPGHGDRLGEDFVVIPPAGSVSQEMFLGGETGTGVSDRRGA
jgi:hypothetical protein